FADCQQRPKRDQNESSLTARCLSARPASLSIEDQGQNHSCAALAFSRNGLGGSSSAGPVRLQPAGTIMVISRPDKCRRGFTFLELVVVVAILAVIAALLFPAVQKLRATAQRASCASNLHQLGIAFDSYRSAGDRRFPDAAILPSLTPQKPPL